MNTTLTIQINAELKNFLRKKAKSENATLTQIVETLILKDLIKTKEKGGKEK